ncbi:MAG: glycoside hydrolase family 95 protein, partial [Paludibacter sp.]
MKRIVQVILFIIISQTAVNAQKQSQKLWYKSPAEFFVNALPIGNGRLAAMVYGRTSEEIINLNEETLWAGGPINSNPNPAAPSFLPMIRKALDENNYELADQLSRKMQGNSCMSYMPVGDLVIKQDYVGEVSNYYRELDISNAVTSTRFSVGNTTFTREVFASAPDQVIVIHLISSISKQLDFNVSAKSVQKILFDAQRKDWIMNGNAPFSTEPPQWGDACKGMRFQLRIRSIENDGKEMVDKDGIHISGATNVTLVASIATSFNGYDKCPISEGRDEAALAKGYFNGLGNKKFKELKSRHIADYSNYFQRLKFELSHNPEAESLPTDERLQRYQTDKSDQQLEVLLYQYGRYLLISSSRPGGIPANLSGKWSVGLKPPWKSSYTTNINLEMNYWAAQKTGLGDMAEPLIQQVINMSKTGAETAKNIYGCGGWAAAHNSDIWASTNPIGDMIGDPRWANFSLAGVWLCQSVWEKYAYNGDKEYLRKVAYPLMKGAAEFCLDWLIEDGKGHLITSPSTSPENSFKLPDGKIWSVTKTATIDLALIRNLFTNLIEASNVLGTDVDLAKKLQQTKDRLLPYQIGKKGNLQEWAEDYDDKDPKHRHVSHLLCLHPGNEISALETPELFNACKKTLELRGDGGTGWSIVWKVCFWARLLDGNHAYKMLQNDLNYTTEKGFTLKGGTYPNLLGAHPPYQIDGNFGVVEGISEMLMQSHQKEIYLLPALPDAWAIGSISGLKARGGYDVAMQWENSKLKSATILSK